MYGQTAPALTPVSQYAHRFSLGLYLVRQCYSHRQLLHPREQAFYLSGYRDGTPTRNLGLLRYLGIEAAKIDTFSPNNIHASLTRFVLVSWS